MRFLTIFLSLTLLGAAANATQFSAHYFDLGPGGIVRALAADKAGDLFVVSTTVSGSAQTIVVTKTDPTGNVTATFRFGGSGQDQPAAAVIDPTGDLVIGGATTSADFPLVSPLQTSGSGFLTKLDPQLQTILYSTRLGTPLMNGLLNGVNAIAFDATSNVYVTGTAGSGMPATAGAIQAQAPVPASSAIASYGFVAEVSAAGDKLLFSTYFTGTKTGGLSSGGLSTVFISTNPAAIALDSGGDVIVAGTTDTNDLPVSSGAYATQCGCGYQQNAGFVAKIANGGTRLVWGTYVPLADPSGYTGAGALTGVDIAAMALDGSGNILIAGSTLIGFPITIDALQPSYPPTNGAALSPPQAGFLAKLDPSGSRLLYGTYFGGNNPALPVGQTGPIQAGVGALAVDSLGTIWLAGASAPAALPTQPAVILGPDYVSSLSASGTAVTELDTAPAGAASDGIVITSQGSVAAIGYPDSLVIGQVGTGPSILGIAGSAMFQVSPVVAARELMSIYGIGIGPTAAQPAQITSGVIASSLSGTQVLFDGAPAALLYAGSSQINVIVPTAVAGQSQTVVQIVTPLGTIAGPVLTVRQTVPQVFVDGSGHAFATNQDGTVNSQSNPAAAGTIVSIFMTGAGDVPGGRPDNGINTTLNDNPFPISVLSSANAQDGGMLSLEVFYDGDAPAEPSGVSQINFQLPPQSRLSGTANALKFQIEAGAAISDSFSIWVK